MKNIKTTPSAYFCRPSRVLQLFPTWWKIRYDDFFLTLHRPAKIYVKSNLQKSGSCCNLSEHACSMLTVYKSDTRMLLYQQTVRCIKIDGGHWNPFSTGDKPVHDRNRTAKDLPAKCSEKGCPVAPFATSKFVSLVLDWISLSLSWCDQEYLPFTKSELFSYVIVWAWAF